MILLYMNTYGKKNIVDLCTPNKFDKQFFLLVLCCMGKVEIML